MDNQNNENTLYLKNHATVGFDDDVNQTPITNAMWGEVEKKLIERFNKSSQRMPRFKSLLEFIKHLPEEQQHVVFELVQEKGIAGNRMLELVFMFNYGAMFEMQDMEKARHEFSKRIEVNLNQLSDVVSQKFVESVRKVMTGIFEKMLEAMEHVMMTGVQAISDQADRLEDAAERFAQARNDVIEQSMKEIAHQKAMQLADAKKFVEQIKVTMKKTDDAIVAMEQSIKLAQSGALQATEEAKKAQADAEKAKAELAKATLKNRDSEANLVKAVERLEGVLKKLGLILGGCIVGGIMVGMVAMHFLAHI